MNLNIYLSLVLIFLFNDLYSQTMHCLENQSNPNYYTINQVTDSDTIVREYILHLPDNYDDNTPTPLIINLHGFGDCASKYSEFIGKFYNFDELANEENIIVAYPQGAFRPEKEDMYWEPGDNGVQNIYENDVYFIEELILNLSNQYNIDSEKVFSCGYSNGGMMAYSLACNRSSLFSAIGIMSGTMLEEECSIENPVPIIKFHGIDDGVLPYNGSQWYQSVQEVVNFWLDQNNIPNNNLVSSELNGGKVILNQYYGSENNSCLSLYTINEEYDKPGDHVWFSEEIEGNSPNRIMWDFFKENCSSVNSVNIQENQFFLFPNPANHKLQLRNIPEKDYFISDINGNLVLQGSILHNQRTIDIELLENGVYVIKMGDEINKFIKIGKRN